jgi:hypothetical protein
MFKRRVTERAAKALNVAHHIRRLARTNKDGLPLSVLYGTEVWYGGGKQAPKIQRTVLDPTVTSSVPAGAIWFILYR